MNGNIEELFKLLEESSHIPGNDVERFIKDRQVFKSNKPTKNPIIYWVYLLWCEEKALMPIARNQFFKLFKKYFKPASRDKYRRYYATSKHFNLHPRDFSFAEREVRAERQWHGAKKGPTLKNPKYNASKERMAELRKLRWQKGTKN